MQSFDNFKRFSIYTEGLLLRRIPSAHASTHFVYWLQQPHTISNAVTANWRLVNTGYDTTMHGTHTQYVEEWFRTFWSGLPCRPMDMCIQSYNMFSIGCIGRNRKFGGDSKHECFCKILSVQYFFFLCVYGKGWVRSLPQGRNNNRWTYYFIHILNALLSVKPFTDFQISLHQNNINEKWSNTKCVQQWEMCFDGCIPFSHF